MVLRLKVSYWAVLIHSFPAIAVWSFSES